MSWHNHVRARPSVVEQSVLFARPNPQLLMDTDSCVDEVNRGSKSSGILTYLTFCLDNNAETDLAEVSTDLPVWGIEEVVELLAIQPQYYGVSH